MIQRRTLILTLAIGLFLASACLVWLPFYTQNTLYESGGGGAVPAGEITASFGLSQNVIPAGSDLPTADGLEYCFGIRFATYQRINRGYLLVNWQQDGRQANWRVDASSLKDNTFRYFCPDVPFSPWQPFELQTSGVDGDPGRSATLWLVDDNRLGQAAVKNATVSDKALQLEVTARKRIDLPATLRVNRGAFLLGWICTLFVGIVALAFAFWVTPSPLERPKMAVPPAD
ncbi:hypothetical protein [Luteimonas sp. A478]